MPVFMVKFSPKYSPIDQPYLIKKLTVGQMATNCYILANKMTNQAILIDPGDDGQFIIDQLAKLQVTPIIIIATHAHFDHVMAAYEIQTTYQIPFILHKDDLFLLSRMSKSAKYFLGIKQVDPIPLVNQTIVNKDIVNFGKIDIDVIHTPGHTPGSICLYIEKLGVLFSGDTIFAGGQIGRTDFSYSDSKLLTKSISRLLSLNTNTIIYTGHGEDSTISAEKYLHNLI
jgi:hydroxyacylglutathione hydrolase